MIAHKKNKPVFIGCNLSNRNCIALQPYFCRPVRRGYTLIEILVATTLSLMLMAAVIRMFGDVGDSISESRAILGAAERLRLTAMRLQQDLDGITVTMDPPRSPENNEGYFEYIEGPVTETIAGTVAKNTDANTPDTTVGDFDDILMFTTRCPNADQPFVGRFGNTVTQSDVAEVAWFVRGRTLYRRQLLVNPTVGTFTGNYDVSARWENNNYWKPNTLADLTRREYRFAHRGSFPSNIASTWYWTCGNYTIPTLPTLRECCAMNIVTEDQITPPSDNRRFFSEVDFWSNDPGKLPANNMFLASGNSTSTVRQADDVILTNVIGFDVKAWDPQAQSATGLTGDYVDLGVASGTTSLTAGSDSTIAWNGINITSKVPPTNGGTTFTHPGVQKSSLSGGTYTSCIYDTYSTHYNSDSGANGFDDDGNGLVDDAGEKETSPPYPAPLRGIKVTIRIFEPSSRQIREYTVIKDFLPH